MAKSKNKPTKTDPKNDIAKDSVLHDEALNLDMASDDVEVLNDDVNIDNTAVTGAAVVKNTAPSDEQVAKESSKATSTDANDTATKVYENRLADVLMAKASDKEAVQDKEVQDKADNKAELAQKAQDATEDIQKVAQEKAEELAQKTQALKEEFLDKKDELGEHVQDKKDELVDKAQALKEDVVDKAQDAKETVVDKAQALKDDLTDKAEAAKEVTQDKVDELGQNLQDKKEQIFDKALELKEKAQDGLSHALQTIKEKTQDVTETVKEKANELKDSLQEKAEDVSTQAQELKQNAQTQVGELKEQLESKAHEARESLQATKEDATQVVGDKIDELKEGIDQLKSSASNTFADLESETSGKGFLGGLSAFGAFLAQRYAKNDAYEGIDLSQEEVDTEAFRRQSGQIGQQLFGAKGVNAHKLAQKFVSEDKLEGFAQGFYVKLADWANTWAQQGLAKDERFENLPTLSEDEREAFAQDIKNQNRSLATLGGICGFMGLKGVVIDTAWLLMVSLRSVYQLSLIYDKPLTGEQGAKLAYGILSSCNLDKLQEKQVIMTALALGDTVLKNAQTTSLGDELKKVGEKYQNRSYARQLDELTNHINLDKFNPKWLHYVLPIGSTAVSVHYNNELIEEVLGVAQATFFEQEVVGLLEDKTKSLPADSTQDKHIEQ